MEFLEIRTKLLVCPIRRHQWEQRSSPAPEHWAITHPVKHRLTLWKRAKRAGVIQGTVDTIWDVRSIISRYQPGELPTQVLTSFPNSIIDSHPLAHHSTSGTWWLGQEQWGSSEEPLDLKATTISTHISDLSLFKKVIPTPQTTQKSTYWTAIILKFLTLFIWSNFVPRQSMKKVGKLRPGEVGWLQSQD